MSLAPAPAQARKALALLTAAALLLPSVPMAAFAGPGDEGKTYALAAPVAVQAAPVLERKPGDGRFERGQDPVADALAAAAAPPAAIVYVFCSEEGRLVEAASHSRTGRPAIELLSDGKGGLQPRSQANGEPSRFNADHKKLFAPGGYEAAVAAVAAALKK